ncbi:unnamed protein product [Dicrocoelium dendriticum]|nr:unnamed protein product [Dicrocoelium dendriticum]
MPKLAHFIDGILATPFQPKPQSPTVDLDFIVDLDFQPITPIELTNMIEATTTPEHIPKEQPDLDTDTLFETIKSEFNTDSKLWTFIYRGPPPVFTKDTHVNALITHHTDHYHFVFQSSPTNRNRSLQRLLKACSIPDSFTFDILTTIQPVID